jgi:hypothetical protein
MSSAVVIDRTSARRSQSLAKGRSFFAACAMLPLLIALGVWGSTAAAAPSSWSVSTTANVAGADSLSAVSCKSVDFCMGVGSYVNSSNVSQNLTEIWTGSHWLSVTVPDAGTGANLLTGVSCTTSTHCVAVGDGTVTYTEGIVLTFNGTAWSNSSTLSLANGDYSLNAVSCRTRAFCVAVGNAANDGGRMSVIYQWNGTSWGLSSFVTLNLTLVGVSCASPTFCVAVGNEPGNPYQQGVLLVYSNGRWSVSDTLIDGHGDYTLSGVSCSSSTFCEAVGYLSDDAGILSLVETWNGTGWTAPSTATIHDAALLGASCTSSTSCVASGYSINNNVNQNLIEAWNGTTWTETPTPDLGTKTNEVNGVSCFSADDCAALGFHERGSKDRTLALLSFAPAGVG